MQASTEAQQNLPSALLDHQRMRAFVAPTLLTPSVQAKGNPCHLFIFNQASNQAIATIKDTQCHSWIICEAQGHIAVRCFTQNHQVIQCCGHGLLCAASYWLKKKNWPQVTLVMNGSHILAQQINGCIQLTFPSMSCHDIDVPSWGENFWSQQAIKAAACGDDQSYLVLQWPDNTNLRALTRPGERLADFSQRALICTALQNQTSAPTLQYRYFAPQYGVAEDIATGSAMRALAAYWSPQLTELTAWQCSPDGGWLMSHYNDQHTQINGYCRSLDKDVS